MSLKNSTNFKAMPVYFPLIVVLLFISSCSPISFYEKEYEPADHIWTYDKVFTFEPEIPDTLQKFDVYLKTEYLKSYPFQNIYFSLDLGEDVKSSQKNILSVDLVNRNGYFAGDCESEKCSAEFLLLKDHQFKKAGKQSLKIKQLTRKDSLDGILKIGLLIKDSFVEQ